MATLSPTRLAICVFAKPPLAGQAKTRLAEALGAAGAARLARALFLDTWNKVRATAQTHAILATTDTEDETWRFIDPADRWEQGSGDLGARMERVLRRALESHPSAIVVGTDVPLVPVLWFERARKMLRTQDAVVGATDDGGFYLIGLNRCPPDLLSGIRWSTETSRDETLTNLQDAGLSVGALPGTFDVDRPADLERLRTHLRFLRLRAPETARVLGELAAMDRGCR
jgi:rSAM/selenodomain-associated transferase 1